MKTETNYNKNETLCSYFKNEVNQNELDSRIIGNRKEIVAFKELIDSSDKKLSALLKLSMTHISLKHRNYSGTPL